jgi:hypothetical protein
LGLGIGAPSTACETTMARPKIAARENFMSKRGVWRWDERALWGRWGIRLREEQIVRSCCAT